MSYSRVKSITEKSEVITIPDEPASKKPRLSDADEKISVSSQSTVEIAEDSHNEEDEVDEVLPTTQVIIEDEEFVKPTEKDAERNENNEEAKLQDTRTQRNIHEASTQLPVIANESGDTADGPESPHSIEVAYDYPSTENSTVKELEKMEEDNLPCSTETDDIQITCGQQIKSSLETSQKKVDETEVKESEATVNSLNDKLTNGDCTEKIESSVTIKVTEGVTVEDMLADFVDEVNDEVINVDS